MEPIPADFDIKGTRQVAQVTIGKDMYELAYDYNAFSIVVFGMDGPVGLFHDENINLFRALSLLGHNLGIKNKYKIRDIYIHDVDGSYTDDQLCYDKEDIILYTPLHSVPLSQLHLERLDV